MRTLILKRIAFTPDGIFGVLLDENIPFALTLELPWKENQRSISCIPEDSYICKRIVTPKHGETFTVTNVPNRDAILFHSGNTSADSQGCILVAEEFGELNGKTAVLSSKKGFLEFMDRLKGVNEFRLIIQSC